MSNWPLLIKSTHGVHFGLSAVKAYIREDLMLPKILENEGISLPVSVCIPTYGREEVLLNTIKQFLLQIPLAREILIVDQTVLHNDKTDKQLHEWNDKGVIRWIRLSQPSQPAALNVAIRVATQPYLLFLDDDIRIVQGLVQAHYAAFYNDKIWATAGQVLQPGESEDFEYIHFSRRGPFADFDFRFRSGIGCYIENGMSGNLCVRRDKALEIGGFDENFTPPVAYRFDNEFCKRLCRTGGQIYFEPKASIYHLRAQHGGTRTNSNHLTSMSTEHGVGDYYFSFRQPTSFRTFWYIVKRPFREVSTKFHLTHPWWIPVKFIGELLAVIKAFRLYCRGPKLIKSSDKSI